MEAPDESTLSTSFATGRENVPPEADVQQGKSFRKPEPADSQFMQKLATTYDQIQEQLQNFTKREPSGSAALKSLRESREAVPVEKPTHASNGMAFGLNPTAQQGSLTATLLQHHAANDCILSGGSGNKGELFDFSNSGVRDSQVHKFAVQLFQDADLLDLCDDGLNKQLQRTKDGATEQSRIQELAGEHDCDSICVQRSSSPMAILCQVWLSFSASV